MIEVYDVAQVRTAEGRVLRAVAEGLLMQRASRALSVSCVQLLGAVRGGAVGARVVLLVGSGNNGGDALWAGAMLAGRGCRVDALVLSDRIHVEGSTALRRAGGRVHRWSAGNPDLLDVIMRADLALDGIVGIGGSGGLRSDAAVLVEHVQDSGALIVAVDIPSGVDADTGVVAGAAVTADVTVTFGCVKPGLVVAPGLLHAGTVQCIDIGLDGSFDGPPAALIVEGIDVADWVAEPAPDTYKYRRGVVGLSAGSAAYPGAALLSASSARRGNVGMVRFLDRADGAATMVVAHYPDIVIDGSDPAAQERVDAWACGPGFTGNQLDAVTVDAILATAVPVVLDAGALSVIAGSGETRARIHDRSADGLITVITPHEGEFERIFPGLLSAGGGRIAAARTAASSLGAIIVLKGPGTIVASPTGAIYVDVQGTADLGTAGSGDVLTGLIGAVLSGAMLTGGVAVEGMLTEAVAAAVWLHGAAGRVAAADAPVTAPDIAAAIPAAIRAARFGEEPC